MIITEDTPVANQSALLKTTSPLVLTERPQGLSEGTSRTQGVRVIVAEDPLTASQRLLLKAASLFVLAECAQVHREVVS
jgi:hypothetical protein